MHFTIIVCLLKLREINIKYANNVDWLLTLDRHDIEQFITLLYNNYHQIELIYNIRNIYNTYLDVDNVLLIDSIINMIRC